MNLIVSIKIGEIKISFLCPNSSWKRFLISKYKKQICKGISKIRVKINADNIFKKEKLEICRIGGKTLISRYDFSSRSGPGFRHTELHIQKNKYSFDSWLRIFFTLACLPEEGILVHGAGIYHKGSCYVFIGKSGSGKSTIIRKLGRKNALSDELVYLYIKKGKVFACSTPFWGELKNTSSKIFNNSLKYLLMLNKGILQKKRAVKLSDSLKVCLRNTLWFDKRPETLGKLLKIWHAIINKTAVYSFSFLLKSSKNDIMYMLER